jgi:hypothetical protein
MKTLRTLMLCFAVSTLLTNCTPEPLSVIPEEKVETNLTSDDLRNIATLMTSYINDPAIRKEILSYAIDETDNEVFRPFAAIIQDEESGRVASPLLKNLRESMRGIPCVNCRTEDVSELEQLLMDNYAIYAPYFAENFADSDEPITITWWDGEDESGVTPGILSSSIGGRIESELIAVDDDYGSSHPTLVLYPLEEGGPCGIMVRCDSIGGDDDGGGDGDEDEGPTYTPRDMDCRELDNSKTLELQMPQYRLHGNTRGWPSQNFLYLWSVVGEYSVDAEGLIVPGPGISDVWGTGGKPVSRDNAKNERWLNTDVAFIKSNWLQSQTDVRIVVAYKGGNATFTDTGTVKIDTDGDFSSERTATYKVAQGSAKRIFSVEFDRCATLASITSDEGMGLNDGHRVYRFADFSFYLKPIIKE